MMCHKLEVLLNEGLTVRRNRDRHQICKIITIQRAWRAYRDRQQASSADNAALLPPPTTTTTTTTTLGSSDISTTPHPHHPNKTLTSEEDDIVVIDRVINLDDIHIVDDNDVDDDDGEDSETESAAGVQTMTLSTPEENQNSAAAAAVALLEGQGQGRAEIRSRTPQYLLAPVRAPGLKGLCTKGLQDSECESVSSDYSELGGSLRELEKDIEVVDKEELQNYDSPLPDSILHSPLVSDNAYQRQVGEPEEDYNRRVRKLNLLSLAQEFAQLKRLNADACPIDFHLSQSGHSISGSLASLDKRDDSLSEADQSLDMTDSGTEQLDRGRPPRGACPNPAAVVIRDISARRSLRNRREGSVKRNSHGGTPTKELRSSPGGGGVGEQRPLSQPVEVVGGDFEVFTMDSSMPTMNWELLERQLQLAAEEERNRQELSFEPTL
ncbi:hypothetical protein ACOMHN_053578 [Nucella lapillus]